MSQIQIKSVFDVAVNRGVKILVYGRSGMGKTMLCATAPTPILASAESGLLSLSHANQERIFGPGKAVDVPIVEISSLADLIQFYEWVTDKDCPFETICLDSITEIGEKVLANALKQVSDPRQAYGELLEKMTNTLKMFRDIDGKHVVFIAKETPNKDGGTPLNIPMMPGTKVGPAMPYLVDEVFHLNVGTITEGPQKGQTYRYLLTQPSVEFDAKDRSGALETIEEPNLTNIISKIKS